MIQLEVIQSILLSALGACPWEYQGWGNIYQVIAVTHVPVWMLLGAIAELYRKKLEELRLTRVRTEVVIETESLD